MLYATTGLRRDEILSLKPEDIDFSKRMITPNNHIGETKKPWVSFYNEEADCTERVFGSQETFEKPEVVLNATRRVVELWRVAQDKTGINTTPQKLRQWFCSEMLRLGVSETC